MVEQKEAAVMANNDTAEKQGYSKPPMLGLPGKQIHAHNQQDLSLV